MSTNATQDTTTQDTTTQETTARETTAQSTTTRETTAQSTWRIDADHTQVWFSVRHMMFATVKGQFPAVSGELKLDEKDPAQSVIDVQLDASKVDTHNEQRDTHLRSGDFFDVENHPELTFVSTRVDALGGSKYRITGDLTIRGNTREVVLDAEETGRGKDPWGQEKIGFTASTSINRKDYGLTWNQALEAGGVLVSDEVKISIDGQAIRA
ncbi:MAG: YceI family protein [Gemmatimonadetes bacterium]|nr:YceI family protein [Gemmatimonadota bacterium]